MNRWSLKPQELLIAVALCSGLISSTRAMAGESSTPDAWITAQAKLALWTTAGIRSTDISIDTIRGSVTMFGKVASEEIRDKADQVVHGVKGVKGLRNLLKIVPLGEKDLVAKQDKVLEAEVEKALKAEALFDRSSITVLSVDKGEVLLGGKAATLSDHMLAILIADTVKGTRQVVSQIEAPDYFTAAELDNVELAGYSAPSATTSMNDIRITTAVKLRLFASPATPALEIGVDTTRGAVRLFGLVTSKAEKKAAEQVAFKVDGVKSVDNALEVVAKGKERMVRADDKDIKTEIDKAIREQAQFKSVDVSVVNGVIRLTGTVPSSWDRLHVASISRATVGARSVEDALLVRRQ